MRLAMPSVQAPEDEASPERYIGLEMRPMLRAFGTE